MRLGPGIKDWLLLLVSAGFALSALAIFTAQGQATFAAGRIAHASRPACPSSALHAVKLDEIMSLAVRRFFSFDEYVQLETDSLTRHEFLDGQVWAMARGSPEHAATCMNIGALLSNLLRGKPCRTYSSDLRVRVQATGLGTYPDVTVICGPVELDPDDPKRQTAINPRLIVEVLSPSTEDYDRGEKLGHYKRIPALAEVVLVAHDRHELEIVRREPDGSWSREIAGDGESVRLASINGQIAVSDVYYDPVG